MSGSWFDSLPGDMVLEHLHDPRKGDNQGLEFRVRRLFAGRHFPEDSKDSLVRREVVYEAATPYRHCVYSGRTAEEALGSLMLGVGLLSRDGSLDPSVPHSKGSPIIQHLLQVSVECLGWHLSRRKEILLYEQEIPGSPEKRNLYHDHTPPDLFRENETIASLGTVISALGRVKDM